MARGHESAAKRAKEVARQKKQEAKRARRSSKSKDAPEKTTVDEDALMAEFSRLGAQYEANHISEMQYHQERRRIYTELGIETD